MPKTHTKSDIKALRSNQSLPLRDPCTTLQMIMDGLAEIVLEASDEETLNAAREEGLDPVHEAKAIRSFLLEAIATFEETHAIKPS